MASKRSVLLVFTSLVLLSTNLAEAHSQGHHSAIIYPLSFEDNTCPNVIEHYIDRHVRISLESANIRQLSNIAQGLVRPSLCRSGTSSALFRIYLTIVHEVHPTHFSIGLYRFVLRSVRATDECHLEE